MRFVRAAVIIIFISALGIFGVSQAVELRNRDPHAPEITSDREVLEIPCEYTQEQLTEGLTAADQEDGDLTSQIVAGSFSRFVEPGVCNLTYVVFDSANQPGSLTRQVKFTDYHSPRFTLAEPLVFSEGEGSYNEVMNRLGATDQLDGNLSDWITQTDTDVNYQRAGTYTATFEVSNSFGDIESQGLPIHVVASEGRSLEILLNTGIVYIEKGGAVDAAAYIEELLNAQGNNLDTGLVTSESNVDTQTPGCYEIHYQAADGQGNTGETWLIVIVEE